jgi:hypothetical protein
METQRFETIGASLRGLPSRRDILRGLASAGLAFAVARRGGDVLARKGHHKKKQHKPPQKTPSPPQSPPPLPFNAFGCLDVGQPCQADSTVCCSGICDPGSSTCVAHNAGICFADADTCTVGAAITCNSHNSACLCTVTTGNAAFCADFSQLDTSRPDDLCRFCSQDTDCEEEFGPGSACVVLKGICTPICATTDRTACMRPCA